MNDPTVVSLPDGTTVDLKTKEGTKAFLQEAVNFCRFSSALKEIQKIRFQKGSNNINSRHRLFCLYESINCIARTADRETFATKIPNSEIYIWLNHVIEVCRNHANEGSVHFFDYLGFHSCLAMFEAQHPVPVSMALKSDLFQVLPSGLANNEHVSELACQFITDIAFHTLATATLSLDNWPVEKIFKKFDKSGFLVQILESARVHYMSTKTLDRLDKVLSELESCPCILNWKFKSGMPCGDALDAILSNPRKTMAQLDLLSRLKGIASLVKALDSEEFEERLVCGPCSYCKKTKGRLRVCARCDFIFYCSRECQKKDWKRHKCDCQELTKAELDILYSLRMNIVKFMNQNFLTVFNSMNLWVLNGHCVDSSELAVEISFMPDENGIIPALNDPPRFRIVRIRDYVGVDGETFPGWFPRSWDVDLQCQWLEDLSKTMMRRYTRPAFGALVVYHAGRIHVDVGSLMWYQIAQSSLDDIPMNLGTKYWCSPPVSVCQK